MMYSINPNDLTLDKLVNWLGISKDKYIVPTQEEIEILRKEYKQKLKSSSISMDIVFENAVTTWVELMSNFGIIKEGDIINPKKVVLANFMTDDKLISMFEKNKVLNNKRV